MCFINPDEEALISEMFGYLNILADAAFELASERWGATIRRLGNMAAHWIPDDVDDADDVNIYYFFKIHLVTVTYSVIRCFWSVPFTQIRSIYPSQVGILWTSHLHITEAYNIKSIFLKFLL